MMNGRTFYKTVEAAQQAAKPGQAVLPAEVVDGPEGEFILGTKIKAITGDELVARIKAAANKGD